MKRCVFLFALLVMVAGMTVTPSTAMAERPAQFGIQGGYGGDLDWYLGARAELGTSRLFKRSRAVIDFNWFFPDAKNHRYYDFNLNYLWPLTNLAENSNSNLYIGGGLNVGRFWVKDSNTSENWEFGLNALAGFNWDLGGRAAFLEGMYTFISDYDQWRIGAGFLF